MTVDDWISNLFQTGQTRGLSGGLSAAVTLDETNPFYNYRLQRHAVSGDLVGDPSVLWSGQRNDHSEEVGLCHHLESLSGMEVADFTDVLLILSLDDYSRAAQGSGEPWPQTAKNILLERYQGYCQ